MSVNVTLEDLYPIIKEKLENGGTVTITPTGDSMLPMLRNGLDTVTIAPKPQVLKKYDLPFYKRKNGQYVIHRVVGINKDGSYTVCGDNQFFLEKGVTQDQIIGLINSFTRKNKEIKCTSFLYRCYSIFWVFTRTIRKYGRVMKAKLKKQIGS